MVEFKGAEYSKRIEKGIEPVGSALDFVYLEFGGFLCISDEIVVYYKDQASFDRMDGTEPSIVFDESIPWDTVGDFYYVDKVTCENTGGCMVDFIHLKSGHVIALNDEAVCLYRSYQKWLDNLAGEDINTMFWFSLGGQFEKGERGGRI